MKNTISILALMLFLFNAKAQFNFLDVPYVTGKYAMILNSRTYFGHDNKNCFNYLFNGLPVDTHRYPIPKECSSYYFIEDVHRLSDSIIVWENQECGPLKPTWFYSRDAGKSWKRPVLPNGKLCFLNYHDAISDIGYFNSKCNYLFNFKMNTWDSIFSGPGDSSMYIYSMINKKGIIRISNWNGTGYEQRYAKTNDGGKTYSFLGNSNIDTSKAPFSKASKEIISNLYMLSNNCWIASYEYDSASITKYRVACTSDSGTTWKVLFYENMDLIRVASARTAYIYKKYPSNSTGKLYQVSDEGKTICQTSFKGQIKDMYFWNGNQGIILSSNSPNFEYGIWSMNNGGGTPCTLAGIMENKSGPGSKSKVLLYPSPNDGTFSIQQDDGISGAAAISILDITGRKVYQVDLFNPDKIIKLNLELNKGVYLCCISSATQSTVTRFAVE